MTGADMQLFHDNIANETYLHNTISVTLKEIYNLMKECYGPYGSHILIDTRDRPRSTKDGKEILSSVSMNGSISSAVLRSVINVADKQVEEVGDGSTTTMLLLCLLYPRFRDIIKTKKLSPSTFQRELQSVVTMLQNELKNSATPIVENGVIDYDKLFDVIYTSVDADNDLATTIHKMFKELDSVDPFVIVETSDTVSHRYELVKGLETDGSIINSMVYFNGMSRMNYDNPRILVVNGQFDCSVERYVDIAESCIRNEENIIILACGINNALNETLVSLNNTRPGMFNRCPIFQIRKTANDDEFLDMCAMLGAKFIDADTIRKWQTTPIAMKSIDVNAGRCSKAVMTEFIARFNNPEPDESSLQSRIDDINEKIEMLKNDTSSVNARMSDLESRKAYLSKNYAKFYVGGQSPQRKCINYELAKDAIPQAISCMKHGIVPGCNTIIPQIISKELELRPDTSTQTLILLCLIDAYESMFKQLIANAVGDDTAEDILIKHLDNNGFVPFDLRENDLGYTHHDICNSADTDRAILEFATDMASLLATSRGFLSIIGKNEFDIISKGICDDSSNENKDNRLGKDMGSIINNNM